MRPCVRPARPRAGFTLIELLVVIAIMAVLASLLTAGIYAARRRGQVTACRALLEKLKLAIRSYANEFGDFPPTTLQAAGARPGNRTNEGAESLARCLTTRRATERIFALEPEEIANTDADQTQDVTLSTLPSLDASEVIDPWGSPLIYFHSRDYDRSNDLGRYLLASGLPARAVPARDEAGQFRGLVTYQLWSAGPDGKNEDGAVDDILVTGD